MSHEADRELVAEALRTPAHSPALPLLVERLANALVRHLDEFGNK